MVAFREAIDFFRRKVRLPTRAWTDLWEGQHARAFVVAGAARDSLLADFQQAIAKALEEGTTLETFRQDFDRIVAAHGWSYKGSRGWRSAVIYNTNLRTATAAGRWAQIQRLKDRRPYLRYVAVMDSRTRPEHAEWHGTVLHADDDWWKTHYPPNGWNCRCSVMQLSDRDLDRNGWEVDDEAPPIEWEERSVNLPDGRTSTLKVPKGIDTGFGYNVGDAGFGRGDQARAMEAHGTWQELQAPGAAGRPLPPLVAEAPIAKPAAPAGSEAELRATLRAAIGGEQAIFADPLGERVNVTQAIVDHMMSADARRDGREVYFPLIPELIQDPSEIVVGFATSDASGRVGLRRRYIKLVRIEKDRVVALVADQDNGTWSGLTFLRGRPDYLPVLRRGLVIYRK